MPPVRRAIVQLVLLPLFALAQDDVVVTSIPPRPFIELRDGQQLVNFDLLVSNRGSAALQLVSPKLSVFDRSGKLVVKHEMSENGHPPAIDIVGKRSLPEHRTIDIFQPFFSFGPDVPLVRMHYDLLFAHQGSPVSPIAITADLTRSFDIYPQAFVSPALRIPLRGRILVHDGHDYFSHHRRFNLVSRFEADSRTAVNANLYAYDLVLVGPQGELFEGDPAKASAWKTYGAPVFAPEAGIVRDVTDGIPENAFDGTMARQPQLPSGPIPRDSETMS